VSVVALWLPILLSAVVVFVVSSIIHMALRYHKNDFMGFPDEASVRAALGKQNLAPGQYMVPWCGDMKAMATPEMVKKYEEGPVALLTLRAPGRASMGKALMQWFAFSVGLSIVVAYIARLALPAGAPSMLVFRVTASAAWLGYAGALVWAGIWKSVPWSKVWTDVFDGLVYALVTAGVFAALWPS
jgi:hypothetical protein